MEMKGKLAHLDVHMPDSDHYLHSFGKFLSKRICDHQLAPAGFHTAAQLALFDLERGKDGYTGEPIRHDLVGFPPFVFRTYALMIPEIASAVCPPKFAAAVKDAFEKSKQ